LGKAISGCAVPAEIASWQAAYANNPGPRTEDLIGSLVVSQEYFQGPHPLPRLH
jgi:hypothetical protein